MAEPSATPSNEQVQPLVTADCPTTMATTTIEDVVIPVEEEMKRAAKKVENDFSKIKTKIHRYPAIFRSLINKDDRYFVPRVVAIGPYHHGAPHLQEAEEVKRAAVYYFCRESRHSVEEVYQKILSIAANARSCYIDDAVASIGDGDFAAMMFRDGCFLVQYIVRITDVIAPSLRSWFYLNIESILRDIFLLENQLPWLVLDALMNFRCVPMGQFISQQGWNFEARPDFGRKPFVLDKRYTPAHHLLGLLRFCQSGLLKGYRGSIAINLPEGVTSMSQSSSAIELAEIGIKLVASKTTQFKDIGLRKTLLQGELFLPPLVMNDGIACWFINMVALEASTATDFSGDLTVTSYMYLLATLMNREEDVHELRVKGILHGNFSNKRTLAFFNNLAELVPTPINYGILLADLETYKQKRWMWIPIHKFIYNNFKSIVTVLSIIGVLVGMFKSLLSIKQHQQ